jgi:CubicO group peptidase (beta-lactamase class C family)
MAELPRHGTVEPGWESIGECFTENFVASERDPGDLGAGLCVIADGRVVVDLVGGWRDRDRTEPFTPDTLVNAYSVGKGITAALALVATARGLVDLDEPVARHWPDHPHGSTLRQHLAHQAGLPALRGAPDDELPLDWPRMCAALAATEPWWEPGTAHGYHVNTAGFLVGEPLRRAAGADRFGDLLHDWLAGPLGADMVYGVPDADLDRCAEIAFTGGKTPTAPGGPVPEFPDEMTRMRHHAYFNPPTISGMSIVETTRWRQATVPSTNLHTTAKGVARVYAALLDPAGPVPASLVGEAASTQVDGMDLVLERRSRFGLGFQLHQDDRPIGVSTSAFGHYGFGGSIGFADPEARIAVGYVLNRPGDRWQIPRTRRLLAALRERF